MTEHKPRDLPEGWWRPKPPKPRDPMFVDENDLDVGEVYQVSWDDCCAAGSFTSELTEICPSPDGAVAVNTLVFRNGVVLTNLLSCDFVKAAADV